ncbi:MAG: saccharopine dehydrogenase [Flavobacteriales bacterium]|jgi:saccharopine dehydrogenase-like NADP-dependent oxidoreductase|nr:saccharopine dehydrogenase [Flavobacteriales bacterium]MBT6013581.1 saccharopine dehydrogenase [Flavobacteriales bacterium]MBT7481178.1 saccharopine dehydrogenase [Flavobacteriales bacterium]
MKKILVLGAGRSATTLITYLLDNSLENNWFVTIADYSEELAEKAVGNSKNAKAIFFNVTDENQRVEKITNSDIVISMLPASMHIMVAKDCVRLKKNLVTASYVSDEIQDLNEKAKQAGILLLNEIGLDPGIDHMSAMQIIDEIKEKGGELTSFKSFCGGLVHPNYDNNPWNYKFTWNPRNVVLAGQGTAQYIKQGKYKYIPYTKLFDRTETMNILDAGEFEGYPNRDSLSYRSAYGLEKISTIFRGTLRRKGFCKSWNMFVQLGMTDDTYVVEDSENLSNRDFINLFLPYNIEMSVEQKFCSYLKISQDSDEFEKAKWLGVFSDNIVGIEKATPAKILQKICESKLTLESEDKDMVVMQHQFEYTLYGENKKLNSSLVVFGDNQRDTAMAKTVGLPVAIAVKLILNGEIKSTGVKIPITKDIYIPVLKELESNGIDFVEEEIS